MMARAFFRPFGHVIYSAGDMKTIHLHIDHALIADFCRKYDVAELSLFGSVLRDDFGPHSDVDVLIKMRAGVGMTLEAYVAMREELSAMFAGRGIDLVRREFLKNPYRSAEILRTREVVYAE